MFVIFFVARIRRLLFAELSIQDGKLNITQSFESRVNKSVVFSQVLPLLTQDFVLSHSIISFSLLLKGSLSSSSVPNFRTSQTCYGKEMEFIYMAEGQGVVKLPSFPKRIC